MQSNWWLVKLDFSSSLRTLSVFITLCKNMCVGNWGVCVCDGQWAYRDAVQDWLGWWPGLWESAVMVPGWFIPGLDWLFHENTHMHIHTLSHGLSHFSSSLLLHSPHLNLSSSFSLLAFLTCSLLLSLPLILEKWVKVILDFWVSERCPLLSAFSSLTF